MRRSTPAVLRLYVVGVILFLAALILAPAAAQESTPEPGVTGTATFTEAPSATPFPTATPSPTAEPSATETATSTPTLTLAPTLTVPSTPTPETTSEFETATASPSPTGTLTETATATPAETLLASPTAWMEPAPTPTVAPGVIYPDLMTDMMTMQSLTAQSASTTTVNASNAADLIAALQDAYDESTSSCASGRLTINLTSNGNYDLINSVENFFAGSEPQGGTGLPVIRCTIIINGNGATIQRSSNATTSFRILAVASEGDLTLNNLTIRDAESLGSGAGIFNYLGVLELNDVEVIHNRIGYVGNGKQAWGGGVYSYLGELTIRNSEISHNEADHSRTYGGGFGGGVGIIGGIVRISGTTIHNNSATDQGGGINISSNIGSAPDFEMTNSVVSSNSAGRYGGGLYNRTVFGHTPGPVVVTRSLFTQNTAGVQGHAFSGPSDGAPTNTSLTNSCIQGNGAPDSTLYDVYGSGSFVNAVDNWWGNTTGPSGLKPDNTTRTGQGDSVNARVTLGAGENNFKSLEPDCNQIGQSDEVYVEIRYIGVRIFVQQGQQLVEQIITNRPPIPYGDDIKIEVTVHNTTNTALTGWSLEIYGMGLSGQTNGYNYVNPLPLEFVECDSGCGSQGFTQPRLRYNQLNINANSSWTSEIIIRARKSGELPAEYALFDNSANEQHRQTVTIDNLTVPVTNLDFYDTHSGLRAAIFWAMYNESSEGNSRSFDISAAPCLEPGWPATSRNILRVVYNEDMSNPACRDAAYLEVQTMVNGILGSERRSGSASAFGYFTRNFRSSLGNEPRINSSERFVYNSEYDQRLSNETGSNWLWLDFGCWPNNQSYRTILQQQSIEIVLNWLEDYLACTHTRWLTSATQPLYQNRLDYYEQVYASQNGVINLVLDSLTSCENLQNYVSCDPTDGAFSLLDANRGPDDVITVNVEGCNGMSGVTSSLSTPSGLNTAHTSLLLELGSPTYGGTGTEYVPNYDSILQPVVFFMRSRNGNYTVVVCDLVANVYQRAEESRHFPR